MINGNVQLIPLRAPISNGALAAGALPGRLKILGWGDNPSVKGNARLAELSAQILPGRQQETGFEKIALDFEHNTVPGSPEYERTTEPRRVAAYGVPRVIAGEGLFLENLEWTPTGRAEALNYADLSPAVEFDAQGNIVFVHSVALTRNGAVEGLSFFSVNLPNTKPMAEKLIMLSALAGILALPETATEAEVLAKFKERLTPPTVPDVKPLSAAIGTLEERLKKLEDAGTKGLATLSATLDGKVITLSAEDLAKFGGRIDKLESTLTASSRATLETERDQLITRFSADGKVPLNAEGKSYSAEDLKQLDVPTLKLLHANTPVTVPLHARGRKPAEGEGNAPTPEGFKNLVTLHVSKGKSKSAALSLAIVENPAGYSAWRAANGQPGF